jgi:DNA (cytosine-5)-methyltransferase 1
MSLDTVVGLFAGIGGIELGLHLAGYRSELLCEIAPAAQAVLRTHFPDAHLEGDVRRLAALPKVEIVAAGFPCQDLSQAGRTAGIGGNHSRLVEHVFRLLGKRGATPRWLLLENVPFMLQLQQGKAMRFLVSELERLGYTWAYRVIDTRAFGLPQRRQRVLLLASRTEDPREILFHGNEREPEVPDPDKVACGFYWTEGVRGLGWAVDAVPTLKGGSTVGIPSPPAIRLPVDRIILTPDIRDAERLQGFSPDWTLPALEDDTVRKGARWRLVGNAVSVPVARWVGEQLKNGGSYDASGEKPLESDEPWPKAAWGAKGKSYRVERSLWPTCEPRQHLADFLSYPGNPLSARAASGFYKRTQISSLRFPKGFLRDVRTHAIRMRRELASA